ncbi:hypothetical protein GJ496_004127 [Pomphorhynchus laevis]|nr:hypothetical protein GJ496_004127 [Pomphorhynchus laevis]
MVMKLRACSTSKRKSSTSKIMNIARPIESPITPNCNDDDNHEQKQQSMMSLNGLINAAIRKASSYSCNGIAEHLFHRQKAYLVLIVSTFFAMLTLTSYISIINKYRSGFAVWLTGLTLILRFSSFQLACILTVFLLSCYSLKLSYIMSIITIFSIAFKRNNVAEIQPMYLVIMAMFLDGNFPATIFICMAILQILPVKSFRNENIGISIALLIYLFNKQRNIKSGMMYESQSHHTIMDCTIRAGSRFRKIKKSRHRYSGLQMHASWKAICINRLVIFQLYRLCMLGKADIAY